MSVPPDADPHATAAAARDASEPEIGQVIGDRYRIDVLLARGGMARVYRGHDLRLDRGVAIKILAAPYADTPAFADRFLAEARSVAGLSHPNLVHVYDSGSSAGLRYIVMELLDGYRSLRSILSSRERLPASEAIVVVQQLLAALEVVHAHELVHCDVKPANVMVGGDTVKLIDFGIARAPHIASDERTSLGSLHAMSPEQLRGEQLTPASDVFAVGAVLYVALTGQVPYPGDDPDEVVASLDAGRPILPSAIVDGVTPALDAAVLQALDAVPARRFESARAMARALEVAASTLGRQGGDDTTQLVASAAGSPTSPEHRSRSAMSSHRRSRVAPMLAVLLLAAAIGGVGWLLSRGDHPGAGPGHSDRSTATQTLAPGTVRVPDTIGMSESEAESTARDAGLNWTIRWQQTDAHAPGIYDQEPSPGEMVKAGSRFTMFAYRPAD